jgi:hypothetical protein
MSKTFLILIFCSGFFSCKENEKKQDITISNTLVISVPDEAKFVQGKGIDSYVAYVINNNDTLHIEHGRKGIINSFYSISPPVFPMEQKQGVIERAGNEPSVDEVIFSEYPEEDKEQKIFDKNYFMYDTISGIVVKVVQPKRIGEGITGLYIPKLKDGNSFSIFGVNLDSTAHQNALQIFKTIRYK